MYLWLWSPEKYAYIYLKWDSTHQSRWGGVLPYKRLMEMCRWVAFSRLESLQWGRIFNCWFSHDLTKIQTKKLSILPRFYFHDALEQLKTNFHTNFRFKRVLGFVIEYAWISKLLRDAAFAWRPREFSCRLKKGLISGNFIRLNSLYNRKSINLMFMSFSRNKFTLL